ncbi:mucolipin-1 [Trichinella spiralis]|uniref:mucolipin-1 n=1 Tax=Trichinella spiralis TaxID=6334 RepID=UPI0001EFD79F|nr:mucolipin-1 [Trichinella spiralis]
MNVWYRAEVPLQKQLMQIPQIASPIENLNIAAGLLARACFTFGSCCPFIFRPSSLSPVLTWRFIRDVHALIEYYLRNWSSSATTYCTSLDDHPNMAAAISYAHTNLSAIFSTASWPAWKPPCSSLVIIVEPFVEMDRDGQFRLCALFCFGIATLRGFMVSEEAAHQIVDAIFACTVFVSMTTGVKIDRHRYRLPSFLPRE